MADFDKYDETLAWAFGAKAEQTGDLLMRGRINPALIEQFDIGAWMYRNGFLRLLPDFDPRAYVEQMKRDHQYRRTARLKQPLRTTA